MKKIHLQIGCKLISLLIAFALIMGWRNIFLGFQPDFSNWSIFAITISALFLILNVIAAWGMFSIKRWGFAFAYIAIIFSTYFFGTSYLPFLHNINKIFPHFIRPYITIVVNLIIILYVIYLQKLPRRKKQ